MNALEASQAHIAFDLDGKVMIANANFLAALGYRLEEIKERHHSMFVDPAEREGEAYRQFSRSVALIVTSTQEVEASASLVRDASRSMAA